MWELKQFKSHVAESGYIVYSQEPLWDVNKMLGEYQTDC